MTDAPRIDGYDILRELGRGAMGVVFLARDRFLEREVAIKLVAESELTLDAVERFLREARAMARLSHPNVVTVFRAGVAEGAPFLVMELLRGCSLDVVLERDGPLPARRLLSVAIEAARGISAAHARGVVHRDIKPSNLFETEEGAVKVLDFGIAKLAAAPAEIDPTVALREPERVTAESILPGASSPRHQPPTAIASQSSAPQGSAEIALDDTMAPPSIGTDPTAVHSLGADEEAVARTRPSSSSRDSRAGTQVSGTALFMAPEVWRSEGADHATDVWSLGATLYMLATGRAPFGGRNVAEIAYNVLVATPVEPLAPRRVDLPTELVDVIEKCLSKNRAKRFASAQEVLTALERISRNERAAAVTHTGSPYPGLRAMDAQDRDRFFGRDDDVARVIERLRAEALVVLVGASGAGKSSLAAAGVAPSVAEGALGELRPWRVLRVSPGRSPLRSLASAVASTLGFDEEALVQELTQQPDALSRTLREAVARDGQGVLVHVDQLEELVTTSAGDERDAVAASLARLAELSPRGVRVLATARSDLFDRLGALGELGARLGRATELVRPLQGATLREALVEPARGAGYAFEDEAVVDAIIEEAGETAGALPLMAFAMRAWWDRRDRERRVLATSAWESLGGVAGALGGHADAVYDSLSADERDAARAVFSRLVANDGTRRYGTRDELVASASGLAAPVARALEAFSRARLLQCEGAAESGNWTIVHESLAKAWPRLRGWIEAGREDRALHEQLTEAVRAWDASGQRPELLWRGALLRELGRWREVYDDVLSPTERSFADRSVQREKRLRRGTVLGVSLAALALGGTAIVKARGETRARAETVAAQHALERVGGLARGEGAARALGAALALADDDPSAGLAWLVSASRAAGRVTPTMRVAALGLAERGASIRLRCTSTVAMREDGARVACAVDETLFILDLTDGGVRRVDALQSPRSLALAEHAEVAYWVDAAQQLVRWDELSGRRRIASELSRTAAVLTDPTGARAIVVDVAMDRLSVWDAEGAPSGDAAGRDSGVTAPTLRVVLDGLMPEKAIGTWQAHFTVRDAVVLSVTAREGAEAELVSRVRRVPLGRGAERAGDVLRCVSYVVRGDVLLCHDGTIATARSVTTGTERAPTELELHALDAARDASAKPPLALLGERAVMADGQGRARLQGGFAFTGPLGVAGVAVTQAVIEPSARRVALSDSSGVLHIYGAPNLAIAQGEWLAAGAPAASERLRSEQSGRVVALALPGGDVAVGAVSLGVFVTNPREPARRWSEREPSAVALAAERNFVLLGLSDGTGLLVDAVSRRTVRGPLLSATTPLSVAVSWDGRRVAAAGARGDATWRAVDVGDWRRVGFRAFSELSSPSALAVFDDRLAVAARWLGVVQENAVTTLAQSNAALASARITRLRFADEDNLVASDDQGSVWYASCAEQRCRVEWLGRGDDAIPITRDAAVALGARGAVTLLARGRTQAFDVLSAGRFAPFSGLSTESCALSIDEDALVLVGPPSQPAVLRVELPPATPDEFARWVARRTNVTMGPGGVAQIGAVPSVLP